MLSRMKLVPFALLFGMTLASAASADSFAHREATFASGTGNILFLAVGTLLPLVEDGSQWKQHTLRTLDSFGTSVLLSEALKALTHEKRPRSDQHNSFPSGHATAAFAVATMESRFHPRQAFLWYVGAALVSESRVRLHRHFTHDVIAGAALGYFTAEAELSRKHGLILSPFIGRGGNGLQLSQRF